MAGSLVGLFAFAGPVTGDPIEGSGADRRVRPQLQHMCGIRGVVSWLRNVGPWRLCLLPGAAEVGEARAEGGDGHE